MCVSRLATMKPDVLVVEKSVARYAQEELLSKGISLVLNVKPELMERLARCMGVRVSHLGCKHGILCIFTFMVWM